jgi:GNAT superfamily N-acetyltransferase
MDEIAFTISPAISNGQINALFATAWKNHKDADFHKVLEHSLLYVCAFHKEQLIGFVNVAWDGGKHAFLLDTTVDSRFQREGIGRKLVQTAIEGTRVRGIEWLHVDYEPHLHTFYKQCGFTDTKAGLIKLLHM